MKKSFLAILALTLILATVSALLIPALSLSPVSAQANLVRNPGFEKPVNGCSGTPSNWTATGPSLGRSTDNRSGNCSAHITGSSSFYTQIVSIKSLAVYKFSLYMKASEAFANATLTIYDSGGGDLGTIPFSSNLTVWSRWPIIFPASNTAHHVVIKLQMTPEAGASNPEAWFDNVVLEEKAECFVATVAYGTPLAEEIEVLRQFRDEYLLTNPGGRLLVSLYYETSPPLARFISKHEGLRAVTRMALEPIIWFCSSITGPTSP